MSNLEIHEIKNDKTYKLIEKNLFACQTTNIEIIHADFRHATGYSKAIDILNYGLLSYVDMCRVKGIAVDREREEYLEDEGHVNGAYKISLYSKDTSNDYKSSWTMEYGGFASTEVEFVISNNIETRRNSFNYSNEYLAASPLLPEKFISLDTQLLRNLEADGNIEKTIKNYNKLLEIALAIKTGNINIALRDISHEEAITLDIDKVSKLRRI